MRILEEWVQSETQAVGTAVMGERDTGVTSIAVRACWSSGIGRMLFFARGDIIQTVTMAEKHQPGFGEVAAWVPGCNRDMVHLIIDVTHHLGNTYQSVVDCELSWFCVWQQLCREHQSNCSAIMT